MHRLTVSVIVPAFSGEVHLPRTLQAVQEASRHQPCEIIVVDNDSTDRTAAVAEAHRALVVRERVRNISSVRNAGAAAATADVLVFVDADTILAPTTLLQIAKAMAHESVIGGAVAVEYTPFRRSWIRWYMKGWAFWARVFKMARGAAQFCRRDVFWRIGGYDGTIYVGEDVDFYWRMRRYARRAGRAVRFIDTAPVLTSSRRFDRMPPLRLLLVTHPLLILLNWKRRGFWKDWYERAIR